MKLLLKVAIFSIFNSNFWKESGYDFPDFAELPLENMLMLIAAISWMDIIEWLCHNDIMESTLMSNRLKNYVM